MTAVREFLIAANAAARKVLAPTAQHRSKFRCSGCLALLAMYMSVAGAAALAAQIAQVDAPNRTAAVQAPQKPRDVKDIDAVPFLTAEGKEAYKKWTFRSYNRAFAINPQNGNWGVFPDDDDVFKMQQGGPGAEAMLRTLLHFAIQDALSRCQKQAGDKCFIYAQNGDVVWDGRAPQPAIVAQSPPIPAAADEERLAQERPAKAEDERRQQALQTRTEEQRKVKAAAPGANRRALVFGNDTYKYVPELKNARADAQAVAAALTGLGYSVSAHFDLGERDMKKAIRDFAGAIAGGDEVVFYFAGHGVQIGSANYRLPVDIRADDAASVRDESIPLQRVLDDLADAKARLALTIIDACRDNPFKGSGRAIGGRGLAPTSAATGQMIMFSAGVGQQAMDRLGPDDDAPNGLFTRVLLKHVKRKGVTVDRIMRDIRSEVVALAKSAGHDQVPAIYDQVVGDFYFAQ